MEIRELKNTVCLPYPVFNKLPSEKYGDEVELAMNFVESVVNTICKDYSPEEDLKLLAIGSSGHMLCTAVLIGLVRRGYYPYIVTIRKDKEDHHSSGWRPNFHGKLIFIDDGIDTGDTLVYVMDYISKKFKSLNKIDSMFISNSYEEYESSVLSKNHEIIINNINKGYFGED